MKRIIALAALAVALLASFDASAQLSKLRLSSYKVTGFRPTSFTSADGTVAITLSNSYHRFSIQNISGVLYKGDTPFIIGTADDLQIPAGTATLTVSGHASLESVSALMKLLANPSLNLSDYTADINAEIRDRGKVRTVSYRKVNLGKYLK